MLGKNPARCRALLAVRESAPCVRPWNAPRNARNMCRFVCDFATLMAASFGPGGVTLMSGTFTITPCRDLLARRINSLPAENPGRNRSAAGILFCRSDPHHRRAAHGTLAFHRGLTVLQLDRDRALDLPLGTALHTITLHHGGITAARNHGGQINMLVRIPVSGNPAPILSAIFI